SETKDALKKLNTDKAVVKVQVHAGGRGKAGGVKIGKSVSEIEELAKSLIGKKIVNNQTGPQGIIANEVIVTPLVDIKKEYYMACVLDRKEASGFLIASEEGGVEIEEVAKNDPDKILKLKIPYYRAFRKYELYPFVKKLGWNKELAEKGIKFIQKLVEAFKKTDALLLEINPLVLTHNDDLIALDAKLNVDENALFRHPDIAAYYDPSQVSKTEAMAHEHELAYVALDGTIGCMVNGAGLAMATMDIIKLYGGKPANFLDVGGGASKDKVAEGFKIILGDEKVKAILVNIFGGIMNCETLAEGIIQAASELQLSVPLVVRMEGTNVEQGKKKLNDSGLKIIVANDINEAAKKVTDVNLGK
ncbi:MAG: ADP-forming succinate--CoA ligase subunit beta, partial [Parachlamydiaceae bacterium]